MTTALVSQAGAETLFRAAPTAQVSQAGVEVLYRVTPAAKVSQAGAEILFRVTPQFAISQAGVEVLYKHNPCTTSWAQIWTITRTDGEVLRFTSLDRNLIYQGATYLSCNSLDPSSSESLAEVEAAGSMDLSGLLASGAIEYGELHAGLYDNAEVKAELVPWSGAGSKRMLLQGTFAAVEYSDNRFTVEVLSDAGKLAQTPLMDPIQPDCPYRFGNSKCAKNLTGLTVTGTVETSQGQRGFTDSSRAEAAGYFSRGHVRFTTGNNAGVEAEIKEHAAGGVFTLWPRFAFPIVAGDEYEMDPGCTNLVESANGTSGCVDWSNLINFGGEPSVPGRDDIGRTPDVRKF